MVKSEKTIKLAFISGICALAISGCSQSYNTGNGQHGYGYEGAAGGYDYASGQSSHGYGQAQSAYGGSEYGQSGYGGIGYGQSSDSSLGYGQSASGGLGYAQSGLRGFGYGQTAAYGYNQLSYGYGEQQNFTQNYRMVPIYPVYQIATYSQAAPVQSVQVPTITVQEAAPQSFPIYEPEMSTYEAPITENVVDFWPEPDTPMTIWTPKRK